MVSVRRFRMARRNAAGMAITKPAWVVTRAREIPVEMVSMGVAFPEAIPEKVRSIPATVPSRPSNGAVDMSMVRKGRRRSTQAISSSS